MSFFATSSHSTRGNSQVLRELVHLAAPLVLTQLGVISMHLVDASILGRLSVDDFTAGGLGRQIGMSAAMIGAGVASALDPIASQSVGAGDPARAWSAYLTNLRAVLLVFVPTALVAYLGASLLGAAGVAPAVAERAARYVLGQSPGLLTMFAYLSTRNFLQAHHDTRPALLAMALGNVMNIPICGLLVHGDGALRAIGLRGIGMVPHGALGAGIAFSLAGAIELTVVAVRALHYRVPPTPDAVPLRTMFKMGLPIGFQTLAEVAVFAASGVMAGRLGTHVAAAHLIALNYISITFMIALGVGGATSVLVGRTVGAGENPRTVGFMGMALGATSMALTGVVFLVIPRTLAGMFTTDPDVVSLAVRLLAIAACFQVVDGLQGVGVAALRGVGDVRAPSIACIFAYWGVAFPLAAFFGLELGGGAVGLWWGLTAGLVVAATFHSVRFWVVTSRAIVRV